MSTLTAKKEVLSNSDLNVTELDNRYIKELDEHFYPKLNEDQYALRAIIKKFSDTELVPLRYADAPDEAYQSAYFAAQQLDLPGIIDSDLDFVSLTALAEEFGAGQLEYAASLLLPIIYSLPFSDSHQEVKSMLSGNADQQPGFGIEVGNHVYILFENSASTVILLRPGNEKIEWSVLPVTSLPKGNVGSPTFGKLNIRILEKTSLSKVDRLASNDSHDIKTLVSLVLTLSAILIGGMRAVLSMLSGYTKERKTFGKPIIRHQAVAIRLSSMLEIFEGSNLLLWKSASSANQGNFDSLSELIGQVILSSQTIFGQAVQTGGAAGFVDGLSIAKWFDDAAVIRSFLQGLASVLPHADTEYLVERYENKVLDEKPTQKIIIPRFNIDEKLKFDETGLSGCVIAEAEKGGQPFDELIAIIKKYCVEVDRTGSIPDEFWKDINIRALNKTFIPAEYGGDPALVPLRAKFIWIERLAYIDASFSIGLPGPGLSMSPVNILGSHEQQTQIFNRFQSDKPVWGVFALTEAEAGSDATAIRTTATPTDNGYILNGTKCYITSGARADYYIVFAHVGRNRGRFGMRAFLVDSNTPGASVLRKENMLGLRGSQLAALNFSDCEVPKENLLWHSGLPRMTDALTAAQGAWDVMRTCLVGTNVGTAKNIRDSLVKHIREYGLPENSSYNAKSISSLLASMDHRIATAELLGLQAAWKFDQGITISKDASMAKAYSAKLAIDLINEASAVVGIAAHYPGSTLERLNRDVRAFDILDGTGDIQRLMVASLHSRERGEFANPIDVMNNNA